MPAVIHVKLSGEGDFGPVDLECAIPPARLPVVMAALFGQAAPAAMINSPAVPVMSPAVQGGTGAMHFSGEHNDSPSAQDGAQPSQMAQTKNGVMGAAGADGPYPAPGYGNDVAVLNVMDPGMFVSAFVGSFGDLVARLQPRGFAETIFTGGDMASISGGPGLCDPWRYTPAFAPPGSLADAAKLQS